MLSTRWLFDASLRRLTANGRPGTLSCLFGLLLLDDPLERETKVLRNPQSNNVSTTPSYTRTAGL